MTARLPLLVALFALACDPVPLGPVDAGGAAPDAQMPDAGRADAGMDAGLGMDAALPDAGAPRDAGMPIDAPFVGTPCSVSGTPGVCEEVSRCLSPRMASPGFCPGPANIQCCTDPFDAGPPVDSGPRPDAGFCDPDVHRFPNEGLSEGPGEPGCPDAMVDLGAFCIDRYEAALVLVDDSGPIGSFSPYHNPGAARVMAVSLEAAVPQGYITGVQAGAACAEAGKRLCSNEEWLSACRGAANRVYPYGDTRVDGRCNDARAQHPAVERFGTSADWIWSRLGDACISQIPDSLARTGEHSDCVTPEGVFDLMGNLHEWTSDGSGVFRGGFYADTRINGEGCLYRTTAHNTQHWDYSTGFRCCADR